MGASQVVERIQVHPDSLFYHEHVARYKFAEARLQPGLTLDLACGSGYGSDLLAHLPGMQVVGGDIDLPSLRKSRQDYPDRRISFIAASGPALPFPAGHFQNVVTLETIEHIQDDHGYLRELIRTLRRDGMCILSTPNRAYSLRHHIVNPYHVREYSEAELIELLKTFFGKVDLFHQGFSNRYQERVSRYAASIQTQKKKKSPVMQFVINYLYRPIKRLISPAVTNLFIHKMLGVSFPQPDLADISISDRPQPDSSVLIAVCRQPLR